MLRRGLSERSPSVCMFCQHRRSLQQTRLPQRRLLSSTRSRDAGWGKPAFGNAPPPSSIPGMAPAGAGNAPAGQPPASPASGLLPHEIEARQRMLAARAEAKRKEEEIAAAAAPKPGQGFRHTWNPKKQEEIRNFVKSERMPSPEHPGHPSPFAHKPRSPFQLPHERRHVRQEPSQEPSQKEGAAPTGAVKTLLRGTPPQDFPTRPKPSSSGGAWDSGMFARQKNAEPPRDAQKSGGAWDSGLFARQKNAEPPRESSLAKRQPPGSATDSDFWSMAEKPRSQKPRQTGPLDDWGSSFDKPRQGQQPESRSFDRQRTRPPPRTAEAFSNTFDGQRNRPTRNTDGVSNGFERKPRARDEKDDIVAAETAPAPAPTPAPQTFEREDRKSRRQASSRSSRYEVDEDQAEERKPGKKRGGRNSRFAEEEEDDGMDDGYDEYIDKRQQRKERKAKREAERVGPIPIALPELISISNLANALKIEKTLFLDQLAELGFEGIALDSIMAGETAALVAQEYGFEPTVESGELHDLKPRPPPEDLSILPPRPPVVTIMGHVDHGKTTLLDFLRKSSVAAGEHGGITQHIGAFSVSMTSGKQITFLDTPGHAAFLSMRQRGANVTDIVVLVVAADDSVKPQTLEAIKHARGSKVPIIVAINKIDKDGAQIDRVKSDLASHGVEIEDFGGDVQVVCVSGKTGQGMDDLEENILTLSEILDVRAEPDGPAEGWILESSLKPIGKVATVLVKRGTLRPGDHIVAGTTFAKIRHLRNEAGQEIEEAPPGTPVEILGWRDLPAAGDQVIQGEDERQVRTAAEYREDLREREQDAAAQVKIAEQRKQLFEQRREEKAAEEGKHKRVDGTWGTQEVPSADEVSGVKMVNFIVKGDVHGSVEAVSLSIQEIGSNEVRPRLLSAAAGAITESDVEHAATSNAALINFNLPISGLVKHQAELAGVKILDHNVIYHLTDDVKKHMSSFLGVDLTYKVVGEAEILQVFPINIKGRQYKNIAGCRIRNGLVERNNLFRVMRAGEKIYEGKLESLKHVKKDIDEARKGTECGIGFEFFQDLEVGDQIQAVEEISTQRML